jgi:hypothetical protein
LELQLCVMDCMKLFPLGAEVIWNMCSDIRQYSSHCSRVSTPTAVNAVFKNN